MWRYTDLVGGIAWQTAGWLFAVFVASSSKYAAIYSSFSILVLFMIWLYVSWLVLLFGASVAFYAEHPEYLILGASEPRLSNRMRERLGLATMNRVASRFIAGEQAPSVEEFTREFGVPMHVLGRVLDALEGCGLLVQSADDPPRYLPARDPSFISVAQVLDALRSAGEARFLAPDALPASAPVEQALEKVQSAVESAVGATSLRELAAQGTPATVTPRQDRQEPRL